MSRLSPPATGGALLVTGVPTLALGVSELSVTLITGAGPPFGGLVFGLPLTLVGSGMIVGGALIQHRYRTRVKTSGLEPPWSGAGLDDCLE
jgi:hypothetical protein